MPDKLDRKTKTKAPAAKPSREAATGAALRSVYQNAVEEQVPDEMLALLSKLD